MNCPRCETTALQERDRDGITIDICSGCRGMWLDRGELEKLIARANRDDDRRGGRDLDDRRGGRDLDDRRGGRDDDDDDRERGGRRGGFFASIGDLFD